MKKAGSSTRAMEGDRRYKRKRIGVIAIGAVLIMMAISMVCSKIGGWGAIIISIVALFSMKFIGRKALSFMNFLFKREKHARQGAEGEEKIGGILDSLNKERFQIFHDVVIGYGNIDHLVLRRDGAIYMIETKSQWGEITLEGSELLRDGYPLGKDMLKQTLGNVMGLNSHITRYAEGRKIWVNGILCFSNAFVKVRAPYKNIQIIPGKWLIEKLEKGNANLDLADWLWEHMATLTTLPPKAPETEART